MFGAATLLQNACLAVSVRVHGTERREASVNRRDRVVT